MLKVKGSIWIENNDGAFIGNGRILLLERIKKYGSITVAAKSMRMSYRQAWELVSSMNRQSGKALVETFSGGAGGGGAKVTKEGERFIESYRGLQDRFHKFNEEESKKLSY